MQASVSEKKGASRGDMLQLYKKISQTMQKEILYWGSKTNL